MRVRGRYAKSGRLRFVSAIDLGRLWERALRKADLPIAYSEGFSPHPKVSFPDALPLGYASTGEYVELTFAAPIRLPDDIRRLNAAFPDGLRILHTAPVPDGAPKLAKRLRASMWTLDYPETVDGEGLQRAVETVRSVEELLVERQRRGDSVTVDLHPSIHQISITTRHVTATLLHTQPPVRPSEVHLALQQYTDGPLADAALITRVAQGVPNDLGLAEALTDEQIRADAGDPTPDRALSAGSGDVRGP